MTNLKNNENQKKLSSDSNVCSPEDFFYDSDEFYKAIVECTDDYIYICNIKTGIIHYTKALIEEFDFPGEYLKNPLDLWKKIVHPDDWERFYTVNIDTILGESDYHIVEFRAKNKVGQWVWLQCRGRMLCDENGEPNLFAGFMANLDRRNKMDYKTGLYNRFVFEKKLKTDLDNPNIIHMAIVILGMDDFSAINDRYNHDFGDEVLRVTAQKIQSILPGNANLFHLSGDRFGLIITNARQHNVREIYHSINSLFNGQQLIGEKFYYSSLSGGCAVYPEDGNNYLDLLKYAESALTHSKKSGKNQITFYSKALTRQRERYIELIELFRSSMKHNFNGFSLVYQPQLSGRTNEIIGVEALVRWNHPKTGPVSPIEFIPVLETSGLIVPVGKWIFKEAAQACKRFSAYWPDLSVSINISYIQLEEPGFLSFINSVIEETRIDPKNLVVELTETCIATNINEVRMLLENFRFLGIKIAMDDFGTGYSSLSVLKEAPADIVKVDQSFVKGVEKSKFNENFIRFITIVCHDAQIDVCLEGVETNQEYNIVKEMDIDCIQGYLFGKPQSEEQLIENFS